VERGGRGRSGGAWAKKRSYESEKMKSGGGRRE
jgi:hypothetical protein